MAKALGVDYSFTRPNVDAMAAAGVKFAVRYVSPPPNRKNLTRAEAEELWAHGIATVLVWETTTTSALGGYSAGRAHAAQAATQAANLGAPSNVVIYFAVDFNPTAAQISTVKAYFDGICSVLPFDRVGVYGGLRTITAAHKQGWARYLWQTYAWSGGVWHNAAHARQWRNGVPMGGGDVDLNHAMVDYIGQWDGDGTVPDWEGLNVTTAKEVWDYAYQGAPSDRPMRAADWLREAMKAKEAVEELDKKVTALAVAIGERPAGATSLTPADVDAIVSGLRHAVISDVLAAVTAVDAGKAQPGGDSPASGG